MFAIGRLMLLAGIKHDSSKPFKGRRSLCWTLSVSALILLVALVVLEINTYYLRDRAIALIYGSRPIRLSCAEHPTLERAHQIHEQKLYTVRRIEAVNPGFVRVDVYEPENCPGRGRLSITYGGRSDKEKIRAIIGDDALFWGIPYSLHNI